MPTKKLVFLLFLFITPIAFAVQNNFGNNRGIGMNLSAGVTNAPSMSYIPEPIAKDQSYSKFFGFGPTFDFGNWGLQGHLYWYDCPSIKGSDASYTETAKANVFNFDARLMFFPKYFNAKTRFFMGAGMGIGRTYINNSRTYTNGNTFTEKLKGGAQMFTAFLGLEKYIVQNYSGIIEIGYRNYLVDNLLFAGNSDSTGAVATQGTEKYHNGKKTFFAFRGFYFQTGISLNF